MIIDHFLNKIEKRFEENTLPNLFILKMDTDQFQNFYDKCILKITKKKLNSHPDFLKVVIDEGEKSYKVESKNIAEFNKFLNFKPSNIKTKFSFIFDAHLISEVLFNKFLKTFEESNSTNCIFLIIPKEESLLPTIKSRAIEFYLDSEIKNSKIEIIDPAIILENFKSQEISFEEAFNQLINYNLKNSNRPSHEVLDAIKIAQKAYQFNNSKQQILSFLMP